MQNPGLTATSITTNPSGRLLPGATFTLTATAASAMLGGTLFVVPPNSVDITCQPSSQTGQVTSLQITCTVGSAVAAGQYSLGVIWVTNAQVTSTASKSVDVVSAVSAMAKCGMVWEYMGPP
jgi:hypothetical protein